MTDEPADHRGNLADRVVALTGAASGIGRAAAEAFAAGGARLVLADVAREPLEELAGRLENEHAVEVVPLPVDLSRRRGAEETVERALSGFGRVDVLVNNAGIMDGFTPLGDLEGSLYEKVMAINLEAPLWACRRVIPAMVGQGGGSIVNTASVGGLFGGRAGVAYTVSKHALVGLTRSVAWQYAKQNVRCNAVCPGGADTGISVDDANPEGLKRVGPLTSTAVRSAEPAEVADAIVFLASPAASVVNGAVLTADAGWTAG